MNCFHFVVSRANNIFFLQLGIKIKISLEKEPLGTGK